MPPIPECPRSPTITGRGTSHRQTWKRFLPLSSLMAAWMHSSNVRAAFAKTSSPASAMLNVVSMSGATFECPMPTLIEREVVENDTEERR